MVSHKNNCSVKAISCTQFYNSTTPIAIVDLYIKGIIVIKISNG